MKGLILAVIFISAAALEGCAIFPAASDYCADNETRAVLRKINPITQLTVAVGAGCYAIELKDTHDMMKKFKAKNQPNEVSQDEVESPVPANPIEPEPAISIENESPFVPGTKRLKPGWRYPGGGKPPVRSKGGK